MNSQARASRRLDQNPFNLLYANRVFIGQYPRRLSPEPPGYDKVDVPANTKTANAFLD